MVRFVIKTEPSEPEGAGGGGGGAAAGQSLSSIFKKQKQNLLLQKALDDLPTALKEYVHLMKNVLVWPKSPC